MKKFPTRFSIIFSNKSHVAPVPTRNFSGANRPVSEMRTHLLKANGEQR